MEEKQTQVLLAPDLHIRVIAPDGEIIMEYRWHIDQRFVWNAAEDLMLAQGAMIVIERSPSEWVSTPEGIGLKVHQNGS